MEFLNYIADIIPFSAVLNLQRRAADTHDMKKYWGKIAATIMGALLITIIGAGFSTYVVTKIMGVQVERNSKSITILEERQFKHLTTNGIHK